MEKRATLVFDADDTLLATSWTYDAAYCSFFEYLYRIMPGRVPCLHDVYERFIQIEAELAPSWGIKRGRVAESMATLYQEICDWIKERYGESVYRFGYEKKIREIGDTPFHYQNHTWLPEVKETLLELKRRGHVLCLLTSYDTGLFPERSKFLGFCEFFEPKRVMSINRKKTSSDFIEVSGWQPNSDSRFFSIGNGESDIRPVLDISENWHGVYIPFRTTSPFFNRSDGKVKFDAKPFDHPKVITVRKFSELLKHL